MSLAGPCDVVMTFNFMIIMHSLNFDIVGIPQIADWREVQYRFVLKFRQEEQRTLPRVLEKWILDNILMQECCLGLLMVSCLHSLLVTCCW
jgi:hypothetical protein